MVSRAVLPNRVATSHIAIECELRCALSVKHALDCKDFIQKKNVKYLNYLLK